MDEVAALLANVPGVTPLLRLVVAAALGAAIGFERERRAKPAGLRTVVLICIGAELFTEASLALESWGFGGSTVVDPGRIAAQVVTGVGFLGAGTIVVHRGAVRGLTTAASIWVAAGIGILVGLSQFHLAIGATVVVVATLTLVGAVESRALEHETGTVRVTIDPGVTGHPLLSRAPELKGVRARLVELSRTPDSVQVVHRYSSSTPARDDLVDRLIEDERVLSFALE